MRDEKPVSPLDSHWLLSMGLLPRGDFPLIPFLDERYATEVVCAFCGRMFNWNQIKQHCVYKHNWKLVKGRSGRIDVTCNSFKNGVIV